VKSNWTQRYDDEGFEMPANQIVRLGCCDCGLVHDVVFVCAEDGSHVGIAVRRNNRSTALKRFYRRRRLASTPSP